MSVAQPDWLGQQTMSSQLPNNPVVNPVNPLANQTLSQNQSAVGVNPSFQQFNPVPAQVNPSFQQYNPALSQVNPSFQQQNPMPAQVNQIFSQINPVYTQANPVQSIPSIVYPNPVMDQSLAVHNDMLRQMSEFERQQQEQFQRDMDDQRRILESKQREYKVKQIVSERFLTSSITLTLFIFFLI